MAKNEEEGTWHKDFRSNSNKRDTDYILHVVFTTRILLIRNFCRHLHILRLSIANEFTWPYKHRDITFLAWQNSHNIELHIVKVTINDLRPSWNSKTHCAQGHPSVYLRVLGPFNPLKSISSSSGGRSCSGYYSWRREMCLCLTGYNNEHVVIGAHNHYKLLKHWPEIVWRQILKI